MSIHLFDYEDWIVNFLESPNFSEIYDQLHAEYLFGAFNEEELHGR